jgi:SAM-dependent methyltransferase
LANRQTTYAIGARLLLDEFPKVFECLRGNRLGAVFSAVYSGGAWGFGSGSGSRYSNNIEYIALLASFMSHNQIRSVVDLGCGDWQFSRFIDWKGVKYLGVDVVNAIVTQNIRQFTSPGVAFAKFTSLDDLPSADLLVCKDVMQHWSNALIATALRTLTTKYKYLLLTNDIEPVHRLNMDIADGEWRSVDVRRPPFNENAAVIHSWYVYDGTLVRKATMLMFGNGAMARLGCPD